MDDLSSLTKILGNVQQELDKNPGPGDVGPTIQTKNANPLVSLEMSEEEVGLWWQRVELARERIKSREKRWEILLKAYIPDVVAGPEAIKSMAHFRNVHTKMSQLFVTDPELILTAKDPSPAQNTTQDPTVPPVTPMGVPMPPLKQEDVISVKQAILNDKLGEDGIGASLLMDEMLFDVLQYTGFSPCKLGYLCVTKPVQQPVMMPGPPAPMAPMMGQVPPQPTMVPQIDPMTGQPQMETVQVPIHEEYYARRFSPLKLLMNHDLRSTRFDQDATFMGMEFFMSKKKAMLPVEQGGFGLTEDEARAATEDDRIFKHEGDNTGTVMDGLIRGVELWPKASIFTDEVHPLAINQLVLIDGIKTRPVVWRPSPDQEFDQTGKLTPDSLIGFPIEVLVIRDLPDSPFTDPDSAFTNNHAKQLTTYRRQDIKARDARIGKYLYDEEAFDRETDIPRLQNGEIGDYIGVAAGKLAQGADKVLTTTAQIHTSADDYRGAGILKQEMDETLGISSVQAGTPEDKVRSATETAAVSAAISGRNGKEKRRVLSFYCRLARKIDQLLMRYADQDEVVDITGDDGLRRYMLWNNKIISGRYLYKMSPDSQAGLDPESEFQGILKMYNVVAPDPLANRAYLLRRMARARGLDPNKVIATDQMLALQAGGPATPQPPHGGTATGGETVSQHMQSNSGKRPKEPGAGNHREEQVK